MNTQRATNKNVRTANFFETDFKTTAVNNDPGDIIDKRFNFT